MPAYDAKVKVTILVPVDNFRAGDTDEAYGEAERLVENDMKPVVDGGRIQLPGDAEVLSVEADEVVPAEPPDHVVDAYIEARQERDREGF